MQLVPLLTVRLVSPLPPDAFAAGLSAQLTGVGGPGAPFTGRVGDGGFVLTGLNRYRSTVMPLVRGAIRPSPEGSEVVLSLRPRWPVLVFMGVWLLFLAAFAAIVLVARMEEPGRSLLPIILPAGLAALSWLLMVGVFTADARWTVAHLCDAIPSLAARPERAAPARGGRELLSFIAHL